MLKILSLSKALTNHFLQVGNGTSGPQPATFIFLSVSNSSKAFCTSGSLRSIPSSSAFCCISSSRRAFARPSISLRTFGLFCERVVDAVSREERALHGKRNTAARITYQVDTHDLCPGFHLSVRYGVRRPAILRGWCLSHFLLLLLGIESFVGCKHPAVRLFILGVLHAVLGVVFLQRHPHVLIAGRELRRPGQVLHGKLQRRARVHGDIRYGAPVVRLDAQRVQLKNLGAHPDHFSGTRRGPHLDGARRGVEQHRADELLCLLSIVSVALFVVLEAHKILFPPDCLSVPITEDCHGLSVLAHRLNVLALGVKFVAFPLDRLCKSNFFFNGCCLAHLDVRFVLIITHRVPHEIRRGLPRPTFVLHLRRLELRRLFKDVVKIAPRLRLLSPLMLLSLLLLIV
mmetsp:Transcript_10173/g.25006  ORF Transcript_10173/g.25006 Transcript_10173/m.25006 type:complete len:401 (+) Transcript_10173:1351-2553(+)